MLFNQESHERQPDEVWIQNQNNVKDNHDSALIELLEAEACLN
jgi:hypothetical protein